MKIALLGVDPDVRELAEYLVHSTQHRVVTAVGAGPAMEFLQGIEPAVRFERDWEGLIAAEEIDAILVGRGEDQELHDEQLRKLAQAGSTLVVSHPSCSALVAYELDMIRSDVGGVLIPLFSGRSHPGLARLAAIVGEGAAGPLGSLSRVDIERAVPGCDQATFQHYLALDAYVAAQLIGPITTVSAIGAAAEVGATESLTVHLAGDGPLQARWTATPHMESRVCLIGSKGAATLQQSGGPRSWTLDTTFEAVGNSFGDWDPSSAAVDELERALSGEYAADSWQEACRHLEIAETAMQSLRRKRTLDVYSDPRTEEGSFKGVMAMVSCALLLLVVMAFILLAVIEGFRLPLVGLTASEETDAWPLAIRLWPVYPLLAFLGLQLLLMVARRPRSQHDFAADRS